MNYKVTDTELTSVANAIRTKGGTSAGLSFPDGFVSAVQNIPTGGSPTLITKSITANGTYNASSDNADGYSSVTVAVQMPPYVTGTFTGTTSEKGGIKTISISYSGNGYPIAFQIFPKVGSYKSGSSAYTSLQKNGIIMYSATKDDTGAVPDWGDDAEKNRFVTMVLYKNSNSSETNLTSALKKDTRIFTTQNPVSSYSVNSLKFYDKNTMKVWIADTEEYGFIPEIEYTYQIIYSS